MFEYRTVEPATQQGAKGPFVRQEQKPFYDVMVVDCGGAGDGNQ